MANEFKLEYEGIVFYADSPEELLQKIMTHKESQRPENQISSVSRATYCYNSEHDGIEIRFEGKPSNDILEKLSSGGWRWHRTKRCWYAKRLNQNIRFAENLCAKSAQMPEQKRQKAILTVREALGYWCDEYMNYTEDQLQSLLIENEKRWLLSFWLDHDYLSSYNIIVSLDDDIDTLRKLRNPCMEFRSQCSRIQELVENRAKQLLDTAYWYQVGLNENEMARKHFQEKEPVGGLKISSFWEAFRIYGTSLQPLDIARRMGFSFSGETSAMQYNPRFETLALEQVKKMPLPPYSFDMNEKEFSDALAAFYYQDKEWKSICRKYCILHSKHP